jgi:hypothetical protein
MTDKIKFTINGEESALAVDKGMDMRVGRVSPSMKLGVGTVVPSNIAPPLIVFMNQQNNEPVMTIHPDGKITLGEKADPTEAAAACIKAMDGMLRDMISNAVHAERFATVQWLREQVNEKHLWLDGPKWRAVLWAFFNPWDFAYFRGKFLAIHDALTAILRGEHLK